MDLMIILWTKSILYIVDFFQILIRGKGQNLERRNVERPMFQNF